MTNNSIKLIKIKINELRNYEKQTKSSSFVCVCGWTSELSGVEGWNRMERVLSTWLSISQHQFDIVRVPTSKQTILTNLPHLFILLLFGK